jgi:O-antigen ligase
MAVVAVSTSVALSFLAGGSHLAVAFYDLYADMPLVQWMAFLAVFLLAAGMRSEIPSMRIGLSVLVLLGVVLSAALSYQQTTIYASRVFGSSAYSVTAMVPLIPLALWLAASRRGVVKGLWFACAAAMAVALGYFAGSSMGVLAVVFAVFVSAAALLAPRGSSMPVRKLVRYGAMAAAGLMIAGLVFVQIPALSGRWVNADTFGSQRNVVSRIYLWQGAQKMVAERPILGFGPSGYRVSAVDYLDPRSFQYGADQMGNIDPTVFSPQSPHSLIWEIATRLGLLGLLAFGALLVSWGLTLRDRVRADESTSSLRAALAAACVSSLFVLLVNPVVFPIGLFAAVAAGLAIGPMTSEPERNRQPSPRTIVPGFLVAGITVILMTGWLFAGEWTAYTARFEDPAVAVVQYESALRITPGNPLTTRRLLENRLLLASDTEIDEAQKAVDRAPGYIREFAPNLSNFAAHSLAQAERTGRKDLSWEEAQLAAAAAKMPPIPSTVAEQLHLAVILGDVAAVERALPAAEEWGTPYPYYPAYREAAEKLLSAQVP